MVPFGREVFEIVGPFVVAAFTVRLTVVLVDCRGWPASVTEMVTDAVPTALCAGVPLMAPVEALIERPLGSPVALNANGIVPPVTVVVALYAVPAVAAGKAVVGITSLAGVVELV
jgi:hypothetical protein